MPSTPASRKRPAAGGRPLVEDTPLWGALPVEGSTHAAPRTDTAFRQAERRLKQAPRAELLDPGLARTRHGVHDPHNSDDLAAIMRRAPGCFVAAGALSIADQARLAQCAVVSWTGGRTNFSSLTLGSLKALTEVDLLAESPAPVARAAMISNAEACMERSCSRHHCAAALSQRHGALVKNPPAAKAPESDPRAAALKLVDRITTAEGAAAGCPPRRSHPWREFALAGGFPRKRGVPAPPLRKLRWATLGWHYNWTNKTYVEGDHGPMPELLASLARGAISQSPMAEEEGRKWVPEAAIVNYYSPGDSLTGHADFSEQAPEQAPLVSIRYDSMPVRPCPGQGSVLWVLTLLSLACTVSAARPSSLLEALVDRWTRCRFSCVAATLSSSVGPLDWLSMAFHASWRRRLHQHC
ncbi:hypothetical protein, variant [Fonticula alba]|uniref:Alpha-ketoglutarate-dependent dioxygenase AlkB-like domain-containing protein n=1 Tax=Fonticula alba TaxID=691883 RepID=A0A058Z2E2_FONAL|nr:hypothetical protein, variant [Fonticula alba]KCV67692.1 hypothetical protein, variant [Fonticula alba]|eukprot:XP_009497876.1 hypothetical protein, variant [Fonticula alba]